MRIERTARAAWRSAAFSGVVGVVGVVGVGIGCIDALAQSSRPFAPAPAASRAPTAGDPFWDAVARDDAERVQTLLLRGADTNAVHPQFGPAIVVAARERAWSVVRELAGIAGTRIDAPNARGETAAMLAALQGNLDIVRLLVDKGAELNRPGWTPLHYAAVSGNVDLLRYLLDHNAYIDAQSPNRTTPLMMAARHDRLDAVRMLIEAGADPTPRNDTGRDAADYLAGNDKPEEARWMRERAAEFARRYGTAERPRSAESIVEERQRRQRLDAPRLPGSRD